MKVLITGCLGLVGSSCVELFESKGDEVIGIDANMRSFFFGTPIQYSDKKNLFEIDIRDKVSVEELFEKYKFDAIIHTAAQPSHDWATNNVLTDFDINVRGTVILLEATRKYCPQATFVYVSSDQVYGDKMKRELVEKETRYHSDEPFNEELGIDLTRHNIFGAGKTAADIYVQSFGHFFGMKTACFRPGCITGKSHEGAELHGFLAYLAKSIKEGKLYKIFGYKGKQVRDQIHASDLANAFWHFIQNPKIGAVYNIGGGESRSVSILEATKLIEEETGKKCDYEIHEGRETDRQWDVHDISDFRKDYPKWDYKFSLQDIIKDVCAK